MILQKKIKQKFTNDKIYVDQNFRKKTHFF